MNYVTTILRLKKDIEKANGNQPLLTYSLSNYAQYAFLHGICADGFNISPEKRYSKILTGVKVNALAESLDDVCDNSLVADTRAFMEDIYQILRGGDAPSKARGLERSCYLLAEDIGKLPDLSEDRISKGDWDEFTDALLLSTADCTSIEELINAHRIKTGKYLTLQTEILSDYILSQTERCFIEDVGIAMQIYDDICDLQKDLKEGSLNCVAVIMNIENASKHRALGHAFRIKRAHSDKVLAALASEEIRADVKLVMKNLHTLSDTKYFAKYISTYPSAILAHISG